MGSTGVEPLEKEEFQIIDGPDVLGFYTAYSSKGYVHLKEDGETPLYSERYNDIGQFEEGYAVVQLGDQGFHIKPDGTRAYEHVIEGIVMPFVNGRADVYTNPHDRELVVNPVTGKIDLV